MAAGFAGGHTFPFLFCHFNSIIKAMTDFVPPVTKDLDAIAHKVTYRPDTRMSEFRALALSERSAVFNLLSQRVRQEVLKELNFTDALELLDHMDPQKVHQVLAKMRDVKRRERLVSRLKSDRFKKTEYFLQFHPQASLSLFHLNYIYVPETTTVGETASLIENHLRNTGKVPVLLVSRQGNLVGEVQLSTLVRERNTSKIKNFVTPVKAIAFSAPSTEAMSLFISFPHKKVVVTDNDGSILGLIYSDDVMDILEVQPAVTLYSFAGVEASERPFDSAINKVKGRSRWLILNLATCFIVGGVVSLFDGTIEQFVTLAIFMPIVTGMGGNASTQTLAIMVRGIAIGEIGLRNSYQAIRREVTAGLINGILTGLVLIPVALLFGLNLWITLIAAVAVVFNLVIAGLFGSVIPLILGYFGKDPATSAGILISTATDILGLLFFLGMATILLF